MGGWVGGGLFIPLLRVTDEQEPGNVLGGGGAMLAPGLTGWQLLEELFRIGDKEPADLVRLLEEEDPFKVRWRRRRRWRGGGRGGG